MKPCRIFVLLNEIFTSEIRTQLPKKSAQPLLKEEYIKEIPHQEICSLGIFKCIFHELTEKGKKFYEDYKRKK